MSDKFHSPSDPIVLHDRVESYYQGRFHNQWKGVHPMKGRVPDENAILLRSNDYLCLSKDPRMIQAKIDALKARGHEGVNSRIWQHHEHDLTGAFEKRMAHLARSEDSILCSSGYTANVGLIQSICSPSTPVYLDMMAHMSLWEGVVSAKAKGRSIRHNDPHHLERQLRQYGPGIIIVDALYSTDGDLCPLEDYAALAKKYECVFIVDETHSFGTQGPKGAGLVVEKELENLVHFRTIGLSKTFACRGGIILGSKRNIEFLRYESLPSIFSTAVLSYEIAGYMAILDILEKAEDRRRALHANHHRLKASLDLLGYNVDASRSQIIALESGPILQTVVLRDALESRGIFGSLFFPPATSANRCLIRLSINSGLSQKDLDRIIQAFEEIREEVRLDEWPSTRRKRAKNLSP